MLGARGVLLPQRKRVRVWRHACCFTTASHLPLCVCVSCAADCVCSREQQDHHWASHRGRCAGEMPCPAEGQLLPATCRHASSDIQGASSGAK